MMEADFPKVPSSRSQNVVELLANNMNESQQQERNRFGNESVSLVLSEEQKQKAFKKKVGLTNHIEIQVCGRMKIRHTNNYNILWFLFLILLILSSTGPMKLRLLSKKDKRYFFSKNQFIWIEKIFLSSAKYEKWMCWASACASNSLSPIDSFSEWQLADQFKWEWGSPKIWDSVITLIPSFGNDHLVSTVLSRCLFICCVEERRKIV